MKAAPPAISKLGRPRLYGAVPRLRLYEALDALRAHPVTWLGARPGAGKTTLIGAYLDARKLPSIWYQLDPGDADPATFFYYLREAEGRLPKRVRGLHPLPLLTPEYLADLPGFSRRFFRELFSRMASPSALVLDNLQEVLGEPRLREILLVAFDQVPEGIRVIAISRTDPPDSFARLVANRSVVQLTPNQLDLSLHESSEIIRTQVAANDAVVARLHQAAAGWIAGLVLLVERLRTGGSIEELAGSEALEKIFAYFATQLFDAMSSEAKRSLLQLSYLPRMSPSEAQALTGSSTAGELLEDLYRRHLFTDRRPASEPVYQFHALFRSFLKSRARASFSASEHEATARRAAQLLEQGEDSREAIDLYLDVADITAAEHLILRNAARWIAQGRWKLLADWISRLPPERVETSHWLRLWLGTAWIAVQPERARAQLEAAFYLAGTNADRLCALHAAAGVVQTYMMQYRTFRPFDDWIPVLDQAFDPDFAFPSPEAELRILSAFFVALSYRNPAHHRLAVARERLFELVDSAADFPLRLNAAFYLLFHGVTTGSLKTARRVEPVLRVLLWDPEVTALNAGVCWFSLSWYYCRMGDYPACRDALSRVESIAETDGLPGLRAFAAVIGFWGELMHGNVMAAEGCSRRLEEVMHPGHSYSEASNHGIKGWLAVLQQQPDLALAHIRTACDIFDTLGSHMHQIIYRSEAVWAEIMKGDFAAAKRWIAEAETIAGADRNYWSKPIFLAAEAYMLLQSGDRAAALASIETALASMRQDEHHFTLLLHRVPWLSELFALALESSVEGDYARRLVSLYGLRPPTPHARRWPWPVKVFSLGRFDLVVNGHPVVFSGKIPRRPLQLLKVLVCFGPKPVHDWQVVDALWPEEEGDLSRDAFRITLHRLRRLLKRPDAVELQNGMIRLSPDVCWVDLWELGRMTESQPQIQDAQTLQTLYQGELLPADRDAAWTLPARDHARQRFGDAMEKLCATLRRTGDCEGAARLEAMAQQRLASPAASSGSESGRSAI